MQYLPIFADLKKQKVIIAGGGDMAIAKLKILLKTEADIHVYASKISHEILDWAHEGRLIAHQRALEPEDLTGAKLVYATYFSQSQNEKIVNWARDAQVWANVVDNAALSQFISPAIVDRDPVIIAIGTEGAAPVLARKIKEKLEADLVPQLGLMARVAKHFRKKVEILPFGRARREFWAEYYQNHFKTESEAQNALENQLVSYAEQKPQSGFLHYIGAGNGDSDLLTLRARKALDEADLIIYDPAISAEILDLTRKEAKLIAYHPHTDGQNSTQNDPYASLPNHLEKGEKIVRLVQGDGVKALDRDFHFQNLLNEISDLNFDFAFIPGISTQSPQFTRPSGYSALRLTPRGISSALSAPAPYQNREINYVETV